MENKKPVQAEKALIYTATITATCALLFVLCSLILIFIFTWKDKQTPASILQQTTTQSFPSMHTGINASAHLWKAPDEQTIPTGKYGNMIRYGKELVAHTGRFFGPNGSIAAISNGMNCQNCHLEGGTKLFGNNFSIFISSFPKKLARSGKVEPASARIAECFKRSMAGQAPDSSGKEVQAMLAYMKWVGSGVKKGDKIFGNATEKLKFLDRAADPRHGMLIYQDKCKSCHSANGAGIIAADQHTYTYPPLWGKHSFNDGAGMYRLSNLAGFIKDNMPYGTTYTDPQLSDEEAWDVAAFIASQPRPHKEQKQDYPDLHQKPFDAPYGPYADQYSEKQHKYGPFTPIINAAKQPHSATGLHRQGR